MITSAPRSQHHSDQDSDDDSFVSRGMESAAAGLQAILRKLGGFEEILSTGHSRTHVYLRYFNDSDSAKMKTLLAGLTSGDDMLQLESLTELAGLLSLGNEESLYNFDVDSFAPVLINLLNMEHNPDVMCMLTINWFDFVTFF